MTRSTNPESSITLRPDLVNHPARARFNPGSDEYSNITDSMTEATND